MLGPEGAVKHRGKYFSEKVHKQLRKLNSHVYNHLAWCSFEEYLVMFHNTFSDWSLWHLSGLSVQCWCPAWTGATHMFYTVTPDVCKPNWVMPPNHLFPAASAPWPAPDSVTASDIPLDWLWGRIWLLTELVTSQRENNPDHSLQVSIYKTWCSKFVFKLWRRNRLKGSLCIKDSCFGNLILVLCYGHVHTKNDK